MQAVQGTKSVVYECSAVVTRRMYGVLLDSIFEVMRGQFDAEQWEEIQRLSGYNCDAGFHESRAQV